MPTLLEPVSAGELKAMLGVITEDVLASDLDPTTKKILVEVLSHCAWPWLEVQRRRRAMH